MHSAEFFQHVVEEEINRFVKTLPKEPSGLYDSIRYMLALGGKRIRPVLTLLSCELFDGDYKKAFSPALGIEVFHNFTLLHDDIMDKAPLRRAMPTVHKKWNADVAILSGDAMFVNACRLMADVEDSLTKKILELFYTTALQVCEGQQWDMAYQEKESVSINEYLEMIELKTSVLLACSLKTGALIAHASSEHCDAIYDFGKNIGLVFQLHDDLLDVYGDKGKFGKEPGGDILVNKKTFLFLKALELAPEHSLQELTLWFHKTIFSDSEKINAVKKIYDNLDIKRHTERQIDKYHQQAMNALDKIDLPQNCKEPLKVLTESLMIREH
jgi:geranylgeranyl diphosphate synthase, type II